MFYSDPLTSLSNILLNLNDAFFHFADPKYLMILTSIVKTVFEGLVEGHHERGGHFELSPWY